MNRLKIKNKIRIIGALSVSVLFFTYCLDVSAKTDMSSQNYYDVSDTKEKLEEAEKEKKEKEAELDSARQDLAQTQATLQGLENVKDTYQGQMAILNGNLQEVAANLEVLEASIDLKEIEINETTIELEESRETRINQYESMKARIRFLYEGGSDGYLAILFSAEDFGEFLNYADYIEALSAYDRKMLEEYVQTEHEIEEKEAELEAEMEELQAMHEQVVEEQNRVNGLISVTAENIAITADNINMTQAAADAYEQEVDQKAAEAAAAAAEYAAIKAQYEEELRLSQLAAQSAWRNISEVTFAEGDRYLLANLIYCEAGAEPYAGQVAVGAVVINRLLSSRYPDTVTGVIYQYKQFSPVLDGHLALALANDRATASCYQAADEAMSGKTNVGNCLYFRTPIEGLTGLQIGHHIFY